MPRRSHRDPRPRKLSRNEVERQFGRPRRVKRPVSTRGVKPAPGVHTEDFQTPKFDGEAPF